MSYTKAKDTPTTETPLPSPLKKYTFDEFQRFRGEFHQFMEAKVNDNLDSLYHEIQRVESDFEVLDIKLNPKREIAWRTICWFMTSALYRVFGNQRPSALRRWLLAVIFFLTSSYIMCIANVLTEYRRIEIMKITANDIQNRQNLDGLLPDLGFDFADYVTPSLTKLTDFPDTAQTAITVIAVIWLIFDCEKQLIALILRRVLVIQGILCLCRAICLLGTQLPNPFDSYPSEQWCKDYSIFVEAVFVMLRLKVTRTDVFFSGHTMFLVSTALSIEYYIKPGKIRHIFVIILWIAVLFSLYMIIAVKFHYTIDVIIAAALTMMIWKIYHMALEYPQLKETFPILYFLEGDTRVTSTSNYTKKVWTRQVSTNIISPRASISPASDEMEQCIFTPPSKTPQSTKKQN